jgi:hypothetical protein
MKIRLLEINLDAEGFYKNKVVTITKGFNIQPFRHERALATLEMSEHFIATDGQQNYELQDIKGEFVNIIKTKQQGMVKVVLGISRDRREANCYIQKVEVIEY